MSNFVLVCIALQIKEMIDLGKQLFVWQNTTTIVEPHRANLSRWEWYLKSIILVRCSTYNHFESKPMDLSYRFNYHDFVPINANHKNKKQPSQLFHFACSSNYIIFIRCFIHVLGKYSTLVYMITMTIFRPVFTKKNIIMFIVYFIVLCV